ncbi:MAG: DUF4381 domain-containing protein [Methylococcales bacterium]
MDPTKLPLRDIHLPDPIGWWPPAPGWWIAFGLLIFSVLSVLLVLKRLRRYKVRKTAAKQLALLRQTQIPVKEKISSLSALLRRVAITAYPRESVASLTGSAWLQFLDASLDSYDFSKGKGVLLIDAPYRPDLPESLPNDLEMLFDLCDRWIKTLPMENNRNGEKVSINGRI